MTQPVKLIITHRRPHLDEIMALALLERYGEKHFPGIKQLVRSGQIEFWDAGSPTPDGRSAENWERDGVLLIGVGRGRFDEHPSPGRDRIQGETASSLVAKALKCSRRSEVVDLLAYVTKADLEGDRSRYSLEQMVQVQHDHYPEDPLRVIRWTLDIVRGIIGGQLAFHRQAREALEQARIVPLGTAPDGRRLNLVVAETDVDKVKARAFSSFGGQAAACIVRNSKGNVGVFLNGFYQFDISPIAKAIRKAELAQAGWTSYPEVDYAAEGQLEAVPQWYFFPQMSAMFNGTKTAPGTEPTSLDLEQIVAIVTKTMGAEISSAQADEPTPASV